MKLHEKIFEDFMGKTYEIVDPEILNSLQRILSAEEQDKVESHISVVTETKLVIIARHPERLKEIIFIAKGKRGRERIYRARLRLKSQKSAGKI